jgi:hypothetical protein
MFQIQNIASIISLDLLNVTLVIWVSAQYISEPLTWVLSFCEDGDSCVSLAEVNRRETGGTS